MRGLVGFLIFLIFLTNCERKRVIDQFEDSEIEEISFKIGTALTQNKPGALVSLFGFSQLMDSAMNVAKSSGYSDYQIKGMGLSNPSNFNNGLKTTLTYLCYYSSIDGNVVLSSKTLENNKVILTYVYTNPNSLFEILDFELITNGYQLFIGDINIVHRDRKLSEWVLTNISSPGYSENISELVKDLEKAYEAGIQEQWDRAEYFYGRVPEEYLSDPMILEYSIPVTNMFDRAYCIRIFNETIQYSKDDRAKIYWRIRKELFFQETDSLELLVQELDAKIGRNKITQEILKNESNH
ncbi:MAG: hypothetical protein HWE07_08565 [Cytophagia bacterium]|nr:hypothetical protein [Cytophagia bacterium]